MTRLLGIGLLCLLGWGLPVEAARVCVEKATGKLLEYQSAATPGTLLRNAMAAGLDVSTVEERDVTPQEWAMLKEEQLDKPAREQAEKDKPIEVPLDSFGAGAAGALVALGGKNLVLLARKKKEGA